MADTSNPAYRHGHDGKGHRSPTYTSWVGMKTRVSNPNRHNSARYVSRGIDMDPRWQDFETFLADMGERPAGTTLEREDNDRGYWPSNDCIWAIASHRRSRPSGRALLRVSALRASINYRAASAMSAFGQDPKGLEAKPASAVGEAETPTSCLGADLRLELRERAKLAAVTGGNVREHFRHYPADLIPRFRADGYAGR
jgi:hypothetical protein